MKIKRKKIYLSLLSLIIPISSSYTEDFKHDSVIPALKLGEYKILNGCPAILKTERKEEENCPVDYTGTIKYERTLTADKILFGDNVTCEKGSGLTGKVPRIIVFIIHHQCQMIFLKLIVV